METKLSKLKALYNAGEHASALCMAARFPQLGEHKTAITRGADALKHPSFYRQLGRNPQEVYEEGLQALRQRYKLA